jgi:hypothetical protein
LQGVIFSPFIHVDMKHLYNNYFDNAFAALQYFYAKQSFQIIGYGIIFTVVSLGLWKENYHIGASGLIYVLFLALFFLKVFKRSIWLVALSWQLLFMGLVWYVFPTPDVIGRTQFHGKGHLRKAYWILFFLYHKTPEYKSYKI